jgi:hypothetical protein
MSANLTLENNYYKSYSIPQAKNYCVAVSLTNDNFLNSNSSLFVPMQPVNNTTASLSDSWRVAPEGQPSHIVCNTTGWYRISSTCNIIQATSQTANNVQISTDVYVNGNPIQPLNKECFPVLTVGPGPATGWSEQRSASYNIILYLEAGDFIQTRVTLSPGNAVGAYNYQFKDINVYIDYLGF